MTTSPELQRRYDMLVGRMWMFGCEVWIQSSTRSYETQLDLYKRWKAGTYNAPSVANPDQDLGLGPFGWHVMGSYHMPQADGFSHALDIGWRGISDSMVTEIAATCGLHQVVPGEKWHMQWFDTTGVFDVQESPKDDTMTQDEFSKMLAYAIGAKVNDDGHVVIPLLEEYNVDVPAQSTFKDYVYAEAITFTHEEMKIARLKG